MEIVVQSLLEKDVGFLFLTQSTAFKASWGAPAIGKVRSLVAQLLAAWHLPQLYEVK